MRLLRAPSQDWNISLAWLDSAEVKAKEHLKNVGNEGFPLDERFDQGPRL
jgi:hypothetical protein